MHVDCIHTFTFVLFSLWRLIGFVDKLKFMIFYPTDSDIGEFENLVSVLASGLIRVRLSDTFWLRSLNAH